jgi:hypothetical protein
MRPNGTRPFIGVTAGAPVRSGELLIPPAIDVDGGYTQYSRRAVLAIRGTETRG